MDLIPEVRASDSPFIESVWRAHSEESGAFLSMAEIHCAIVFTTYQGKTMVTIRGPETVATPASLALREVEFLGIMLKVGAFLPDLPAAMVRDRHDVHLPEASGNSFWFKGSAWQCPDFDNADTFVDRLVRDGLVVHDPVIDAVLHASPVDMSPRTIQRRFLQATGLTQGALRQIERARYAVTLLKQGESFNDTILKAGYFDQSHLIRSLKHFIGLTPGQIVNAHRTEVLSFLYNTTPTLLHYNASGTENHLGRTT